MDNIKEMVQAYNNADCEIRELRRTMSKIEYDICKELFNQKAFDLLKPNWPKIRMSFR